MLEAAYSTSSETQEGSLLAYLHSAGPLPAAPHYNQNPSTSEPCKLKLVSTVSENVSTAKVISRPSAPLQSRSQSTTPSSLYQPRLCNRREGSTLHVPHNTTKTN